MDALDRLIRDLKNLDASARTGVIDNERNASKLLWQELGTENAPARPTLSATTDRLAPSIDRAIKRRVGLVLDGKVHTTGQEILADLARDLQEEVVAQINDDTTPELAESTKAARRRKGLDNRTLVETGDMRDAITVQVKANSKPWLD